MGNPKSSKRTSGSSLSLCEIWEKLPSYKFEKVAASNGKPALRAKDHDTYVWIPPSTLDAIESGRPFTLVAFGSRNGLKAFFPFVAACKTKSEALQQMEDFEKTAP